MKQSDLYFLVGCVLVAPHSDLRLTVPIGLGFIALGLWLAWRRK